jgi:hypothetical protein
MQGVAIVLRFDVEGQYSCDQAAIWFGNEPEQLAIELPHTESHRPVDWCMTTTEGQGETGCVDAIGAEFQAV